MGKKKLCEQIISFDVLEKLFNHLIRERKTDTLLTNSKDC